MTSGGDDFPDRADGGSQSEPVELSAEESLVLLRGEDPTDLLELCAETGMTPAQVDEIRKKLREMGLTEPSATPADRASQARDRSADEPEVAPATDAASALEAEPSQDDDGAPLAEDSAHARVVADYRRLYESQYHPMPPDQRAHAARRATGPDLFALCFDADPKVIKAIVDNPATGLDHARLVAFHHRNSAGLDALWAHRELARDAIVQRRLVRNAASPEGLIRRVLSPKRLLEIYKVTIDREVPDRTRATARLLLRTKWSGAEPDERVALVLTTEGRVLGVLSGCTFDSKTTLMLCARPVVSVMLIQSLARFAATPPQVLVHLLKQPMVKRQPHLRAIILQHPNVPGDAKRKT